MTSGFVHCECLSTNNGCSLTSTSAQLLPTISYGNNGIRLCLSHMRVIVEHYEHLIRGVNVKRIREVVKESSIRAKRERKLSLLCTSNNKKSAGGLGSNPAT